MANLIRIQYEPWQEDLTKEEFARFSNRVASEYGKAYATEIMRLFESWLRPGSNPLTRVGGKASIGASGAASKNFKVVEQKSGDISTWYVREAGGTPANQFIRKGIPPGISVSLERLKLWAARKGINFLSSAEYKKKMGGKELLPGQQWTFGKAIKVGAFEGKSAKGNTFKVKEHGKAEKDRKHVVNSALKAIQNALFIEGTDRPGANWTKYFPKGDGHFDYPRYLVVGRTDKLRMLNSQFASGTADAMVSYWNSGGKTRVFDYKIGAMGRTREPGSGVIF